MNLQNRFFSKSLAKGVMILHGSVCLFVRLSVCLSVGRSVCNITQNGYEQIVMR